MNLIDLQSDILDERILSFPCYEPAGKVIDVTRRDLLRHLLLIGQTGSGKTTLLNRVLNDLIHFKDSDNKRMGMLIIDSQGDGTIERIRKMASEAGRLDDVQVLSVEEGYVNPIGNIKSFAEINLATSIIISASRINHAKNDNPYWAETTQLLIESALIILALTEQNITLHRFVEFTCELYLTSKWTSAVKRTLEAFTKSIHSKVSKGVSAKLSLVYATAQSWNDFESGTKGVLKTCLEGTLAPFLSAPALPYWDSKKENQINPANALQGKIVVISTHGSTEPETASLIGKLAKIEFYRAAQSRTSLGNHRLAALVMDELPLTITHGSTRWSDVSNLATLRGKGVSVIAATQGLSNLDLVVDSVVTKALIANFSNLILLRSQEIGTLSELAAKIFGSKLLTPRVTQVSTDSGDLLLSHSIRTSEPACPEGALSQLEPHQAYISLANGYKTTTPVWLCPLYCEQPQERSYTLEDQDFLVLTDRLHNNKTPSSKEIARWHVLNSLPNRIREGLSIKDFLKILTNLGHDNLKRSDIETIPPAWRSAIVMLSKKLPLDMKIAQLKCEDCDLIVSFSSDRSESIAQKWQRSVYPNIYRNPIRSDYAFLKLILPDLI